MSSVSSVLSESEKIRAEKYIDAHPELKPEDVDYVRRYGTSKWIELTTVEKPISPEEIRAKQAEFMERRQILMNKVEAKLDEFDEVEESQAMSVIKMSLGDFAELFKSNTQFKQILGEYSVALMFMAKHKIPKMVTEFNRNGEDSYNRTFAFYDKDGKEILPEMWTRILKADKEADNQKQKGE